MQHSTLYQQLINSRKWRQLRAEKLAANPLCERHLKEGKVVAASVVHHIVEVESGHNEAECRALGQPTKPVPGVPCSHPPRPRLTHPQGPPG